MGKVYSDELVSLPLIVQWANEQDIKQLSSCISENKNKPLVLIGAGGSYTAALFIEVILANSGYIGKSITPLEFMLSHYKIKHSLFLLFTASGSNTDVVDVVKMANAHNNSLAAVTMRKDSKISNFLLEKNIFSYVPPTGSDGFLATNTLMSTIVLIAKACRAAGLLCNFNAEKTCNFLNNGPRFCLDNEQFYKNKNLFVLYGNWSKPAAIDLESKLVEAGLTNTHVADFRNFGHGQHNWLDKNKSSTSLLILCTPDEYEIAITTAKKLPGEVPTQVVVSDHDGAQGAVELICSVFHITNQIGKIRGIDPGRPGVPQYGEELYSLSALELIGKRELGEYRKYTKNLGCFGANDEIIMSSFGHFKRKIECTCYGAIVLDYDGTICSKEERFSGISDAILLNLEKIAKHNIFVGIATGRGKSVAKDLQTKIDSELQNKFYVGLYNCGQLYNLAEFDSESVANHPYHPEIVHAYELLSKDLLLDKCSDIEKRATQITVEPRVNFNSVANHVRHILSINGIYSLKVCYSDHSVDIIPVSVSKKDLVKLLTDKVKAKNVSFETLCIGDNGLYPGNDAEMLAGPHSLSVGSMSADPSACWNMNAKNENNVTGTLKYFSKFLFFDNYFTIKLD